MTWSNPEPEKSFFFFFFFNYLLYGKKTRTEHQGDASVAKIHPGVAKKVVKWFLDILEKFDIIQSTYGIPFNEALQYMRK